MQHYDFYDRYAHITSSPKTNTMTTNRTNLFLLAGFMFITLFSCGDKCEELREFIRYEPVFVTDAEYRQPVGFESPREIEAAGVIASYGEYLFVNEYNHGIHMINNTDPANPVNEGFISINNNKHFAIQNGILLANRYHDLVSVDIRNVSNVQELQRITNVFPDESTVTDEGIISHYASTSEIETRSCEDPFFGNWWMDGDIMLVESGTFNAPVMSNSAAFGIQNGTSVSSSTARFTIANNSLFVLSGITLGIFDLANPSFPERKNTVNVGVGSETLFPLSEYLFIGANAGMSIYDISNPNSPQFVSNFEHSFACDPVVANENNAFVTLRSGNNCQGFNNEMDVINIENIFAPNLVSAHNLSNPRGLTLVGNHLFVCDDKAGVVVFDISNEKDVNQIGAFRGKQANDILPVSATTVVVSGDDGIYEQNISEPTNPTLLSIVSSK